MAKLISLGSPTEAHLQQLKSGNFLKRFSKRYIVYSTGVFTHFQTVNENLGGNNMQIEIHV